MMKFVKMKANAEAVQSGQNIDKEINSCGGHQYIVTTLLCNVLVKYNAALPSAVAAERLFRVAGQILVPRCCIVRREVIFLRHKLNWFSDA